MTKTIQHDTDKATYQYGTFQLLRLEKSCGAEPYKNKLYNIRLVLYNIKSCKTNAAILTAK